MSITFAKRILSPRSFLINQRRYGYVVLVPEIGEDLPNKNPLLSSDGLPEFNNITIENCLAAIGKQALEVEKTVQNVEKELSRPDKTVNVLEDVIAPLDEIGVQLETTWGIAKTLYMGNSSLMPTKSYIAINDRGRKANFAKFISAPIYHSISDARRGKGGNLTEVDNRLLDKFLLEGRLNGINLDEKKKSVLTAVTNKLGEERSKFQERVNLSTKRFYQTIDNYNIVKDFPQDLLQAISSNPLNPSRGPWQVGLQQPVYDKFLEHCNDRDLRWNVWQAYTRRASLFREKSLSNSVCAEEIRALRQQQAETLGFENYVQMSMETKMAGSVKNVQNLISDLLTSSRPAQETELEKLAEFASANGLQHNFEMYDIPFWKCKQLKSISAYDEDMIREYFPVNQVLGGLFELCENLFQIKFVERSVSVWHEDVKFYDIFDQTDGTQPISGFYLDLYSRENDKIRMQPTSGWMIGIRNRCKVSNISPLAALIFNFQIPLYGKPSLLSFRDVETLFKNFGKALQHLLTQVHYNELAGLSNIEWDVVEVSGLVMSHMLLHGNTLKKISSHYTTEQPLPDNLIEAIKMEKQHMAGFMLSRELYFTTLDLELYSKPQFWMDVVKELWPQFCLLPLDGRDSHVCSFTDIFSGDYAAAYFSHIWAKVIAADIYSNFYEVRNNEQNVEAVGKRFRDTYLSLGGSVHPSEVFRKFRGRDPSPKALLKTLGLNNFARKQQEE
ncbi:putative cytosolic oligopeptidase A [Pseudolycoriella hygida]|uniref:Cytosolic oligopeptidase A n=1 Tax=Pseudolycoriella hygida TaxID=35572 RepID=A0A9Q0MX32_9DIPT|nr:putative cytosolic oligopeptidase A [Pseudolycoriella hygida]